MPVSQKSLPDPSRWTSVRVESMKRAYSRSCRIIGRCPGRLPAAAVTAPCILSAVSSTNWTSNRGHAASTSSLISRCTADGKTPPVLAEDGSRFTWQREDLTVVLIEPKIPQNSGNVSRTCAASKVALHIVAPAFELDDKKLKRAGLDYWDWVCLKPHSSVEAFLEFYTKLDGEKRLFAYSKFGKTHHAAEGLYQSKSAEGRPIRNFLMFGAEDTGLPDIAHDAATDIVRIPMNNFDHVRSLNLATSVGIGLFEALRQLDGPVFSEGEER